MPAFLGYFKVVTFSFLRSNLKGVIADAFKEFTVKNLGTRYEFTLKTLITLAALGRKRLRQAAINKVYVKCA